MKIITVFLLLFSLSVFASDDDEIGGGTSNVNQAAAIGIGIAGAKATATGGNAYGGNSYSKGGNAYSKGGSVGDISNDQRTSVSNKQSQLQGQKQSNNQGQYQGANNKQNQAAISKQSQGANNKQGQSVTIQDNSVYEAQKRDPVSTATSPALTSGVDTCMGSTSAGAQGVGFGFSFGTTWTDDHCKLIKATKLLTSLGLNKAAIARMCADPDLAFALKAEGQGYCETPAVGGGAEDGLPLMSEITYDADGDAWIDGKMQ